MNYYSRSSLAYDFTLFEEDDSYEMTARRKDKTDSGSVDAESSTKPNRRNRDSKNADSASDVKRIRRRKSNFALIAIGVVFGLAVAFVVASIIHGQVQLTELNQEIANAKSSLAEQQSVYTQYEMKVDSSISTTVVEDYARNKLNMSKASNSQKEFINLSEGDKAEVTLSEDKNIFKSIAEAFSSLWS